jgi:transcriptional regulator with XRE-family HTH domain
MNIEKETRDNIKRWVRARKSRHITQLEVSKMTGMSRSHIANFERLRVNNMFLYNFYHNMFD